MTDVKQALELISRGTEEIIKIEDLEAEAAVGENAAYQGGF